MQFVDALCNEIVTVEGGKIVSHTKRGVSVDAFADEDAGEDASTPGAGTPVGNGALTPKGSSRAASRLNSKAGTPSSSAAVTPAGSGDEGAGGNDLGFKEKKKKTKLTRAEQKAQAERRKKRLNDWLIYGGAREPDTDDEKDDVKGDLKKVADRAMVKGKK